MHVEWPPQGRGLHLLRDGGGSAAVSGRLGGGAARDDLPDARAAERDQLAGHRQERPVPRAQRAQLQAPEDTAARAPVRRVHFTFARNHCSLRSPSFVSFSVPFSC